MTALPELAHAAETATTTRPLVGAKVTRNARSASIGVNYRTASVSSLSNGRDHFTVDPAIVERGLRGHAETQNALADVLSKAGLTPRSP